MATTHRSYNDACGMACALDAVGERWALLVVRELILGPRRFTDLQRELPGISTNVLSRRLDQLSGFGVVRKRKLAPPAGSWVYQLTPWGQELEPIVQQLGRWGSKTAHPSRGDHLSTASLVLSLRTNFDPRAAEAVSADYTLHLEEECFQASVADGRFHIVRGDADRPGTLIDTSTATLAGLVYGGHDLAQALEDGSVRVRGDVVAVERFLTLFALPDPAPAAPPAG